MDEDRYARQVLLFGEEGQRRLGDSKVGIVGRGGMGSQIAQGLAHLGSVTSSSSTTTTSPGATSTG
jgi:molybdopterin/thiamine biosynthesis adenylyltransferase